MKESTHRKPVQPKNTKEILRALFEDFYEERIPDSARLCLTVDPYVPGYGRDPITVDDIKKALKSICIECGQPTRTGTRCAACDKCF